MTNARGVRKERREGPRKSLAFQFKGLGFNRKTVNCHAWIFKEGPHIIRLPSRKIIPANVYFRIHKSPRK